MKDILHVHSIESFGTHDGPGVRMVVFLQGCNIKCLYCQNADTIPFGGGTHYTAEQLVQKASNMKGYFGKNGGVTVSGGEPLLQSEALVSFFMYLRHEGIHSNIDTNGTIINSHSKKLVQELADLIMFDIKHATPEGFEKLTGKQLFTQNEELIRLREKSNKPFWLRYVLVPGVTSSAQYLESVGQKYGHFKNVERFQLLPYHKLGVYKWDALGQKYALTDVPENTPQQIDEAKRILANYFENVV